MLENSRSWIEMKDLNFIDIVNKSLLPQNWKSWQDIIKLYENDIIKPVNPYVHFFGNKIKLESIKDNIVTLSQYTHADIYVLINYDKTLYAVDKPHQRQFYLSSSLYDTSRFTPMSQQCFRFYMPWIIDENISANVFSKNNNSFIIMPKNINFYIQNKNDNQIDTPFIDFYFNLNKENMLEDNCSIIEKDSYMYSISFFANDLIIERIKKLYE